MNIKGVLIFVLVISSFGLSGYLIGEVSRLETQMESITALLTERELEVESLQDENAELQNGIITLTEEYEVLQTEAETLLGEKEDLQTRLSTVEAEYTSLQTGYQSLQDDYDSIKEAYQLQNDLRVGNSLTSFYDAVRYKYGLSGDARRWATDRDKMEFASDLARHDLGQPSWPSIEEDYYAVTGNHSYEAAWGRLQVALSATEIEENDTSVERIANILEFLRDHVTYEFEVDDVRRAPVETLSLRSGDCDDYSILAAALLEAEGIDTAVACFENDKGDAHCMVLVHLENLGEYDCFHYDDLARLGLQPGRWLKIEPQYTIAYQGEEEWMGQWNLEAAVEVEFG